MEEQRPIDLGALEAIRAGIEQEAPDLADYLLLRELAQVTHLSRARIYYNLRYGKRRPLWGIKRGDRWFVHRIDALQWAADIANDQQDRWLRNAIRLGKMVDREKVRLGIQPPPQRERRAPHPRVPKGVRVYSYSEAARAIGTTIPTLYVYAGTGQPLEHAQRYVTDDGRVVWSARDIDAYVTEKYERAQAAKARDAHLAQQRAARASPLQVVTQDVA
jgi:hypothetical protein